MIPRQRTGTCLAAAIFSSEIELPLVTKRTQIPFVRAVSREQLQDVTVPGELAAPSRPRWVCVLFVSAVLMGSTHSPYRTCAYAQTASVINRLTIFLSTVDIPGTAMLLQYLVLQYHLPAVGPHRAFFSPLFRSRIALSWPPRYVMRVVRYSSSAVHLRARRDFLDKTKNVPDPESR